MEKLISLNRIIEKYLNVIWSSIKYFYMRDLAYQASALSFLTVLSLVPIISISVYIISYFPFFDTVSQALNNYLSVNLIPDSNQALRTYLTEFIQQANHVPILSMLFFIVNGWFMLLMIQSTFRIIWHLPDRKINYLRLGLTGVLLLLLPIVISLITIANAYIGSISWLSAYANFISSTLNISINILIFTLLYILIPNVAVTWRSGVYGGVISAVLYELAKKIFFIYIHNFSDYASIYGTLAAIPIFLMWIYVAWCIIIFGAVVIKKIK